MRRLISGYAALLILFSACQRQVSPATPELFTHFQVLQLPDTLNVQIVQEAENPTPGDTIPNALFFKEMPAALVQEIDYLADSSQAVVLARQHFPIDDQHEAYWVEIHQFWFRNHSLFVYNNPQKAFTQRITLAEWYGGDGGQILTGSWLFDDDGDGKKDIVRRAVAHSIIVDGENVAEHMDESAALLLWKDGQFVEMPVADTAALIKRYPIRSFW